MDQETTLKSPREPTIFIRLSDLPTYECGAVLFAYLAFPEPDAEGKRALCHPALCHLAIQANAKEGECQRWQPTMTKHGYALMAKDEVRQPLRTFDRRLKDRLDAAIVVKPFLEEVSTGRLPKLPPSVDHLSITSMAEYVIDRGGADAGRGDVKNFHARVWMASLPVIHLAVALNLLFERMRPAGITKIGAYDLIRSSEAIEFLVETAQSLEQVIPAIPRLKIPQTSLWKFRLA